MRKNASSWPSPSPAGTYRWFTEGFDTQDLQDAEALLEALA